MLQNMFEVILVLAESSKVRLGTTKHNLNCLNAFFAVHSPQIAVPQHITRPQDASLAVSTPYYWTSKSISGGPTTYYWTSASILNCIEIPCGWRR